MSSALIRVCRQTLPHVMYIINSLRLNYYDEKTLYVYKSKVTIFSGSFVCVGVSIPEKTLRRKKSYKRARFFNAFLKKFTCDRPVSVYSFFNLCNQKSFTATLWLVARQKLRNSRSNTIFTRGK